MAALSLKFVGLIIVVHLCQLCASTVNDDHGQLYCSNEEPISNQIGIQKFKTSFNISSTKGLDRICEINIESSTGKMIKQYFENTNPHKFDIIITNIFSIQRKYEQDIFSDWVSRDDFKEQGKAV